MVQAPRRQWESTVFSQMLFNFSPLLPPNFPVHPTLKPQWGLCSLCPNQELRQSLRVIGTEMARAQNAAARAQVTII